MEALSARIQQARGLLMRARRQLERQQWAEALESIAQARRDMDALEEEIVRKAQQVGVTDSEIARRLGRSQPAISKRYPRPDRRRRRTHDEGTPT